MTADQLIAAAAANRPSEPPPSLENVEGELRRAVREHAGRFRLHGAIRQRAAQACRMHALLIAEVRALQRVQATDLRLN